MRTVPIMYLGALWIGFSSCAGNPGADIDYMSPESEQAMITVVNQGWEDARIYVELGSSSYPLGQIGGYSAREFRLPRAIASSTVRFRIQPLGSRATSVTPEVDLSPERRYELQVASRVASSRVVVIR